MTSRGANRRLRWGAGWLLLIALASCARTPDRWWYPFIGALFGDYYTLGPYAFTSNTREDNPIWREIPAINRALARTSYAMTRGQPQADVAWLLAKAEWPDRAALGEGLQPNRHETPLSRALVQAGLVYDRISRRDLQEAHADGQTLVVGAMRHHALVVDDWSAASPELLARVLELARSGVPVVWVGAMPQRAPGWADHAQRDRTVAALVQQLGAEVVAVQAADAVVAALAGRSVESPLLAGPVPGLRTDRRAQGGDTLTLLYNEGDAPLALRVREAMLRGAQLLDPESGSATTLSPDAVIHLPARRTRLLKTGAWRGAWDAAQWREPGMEHRPFVRWWWPGDAVDPAELASEVQSLHAAGFGGVELQTLTLGLEKRALVQDADRIYRVGTPEYLAHVQAVFRAAAPLGLRVEMTMGSGWPSGGPFIREHPEQQLLAATLDVHGPVALRQALPRPETPDWVRPTRWIIPDSIGAFDEQAALEAVVAARIDRGTSPPTLSDFVDLSAQVQDGTLSWQVPDGRFRVFALYQNDTRHNLLASAFPGARESAPVLDHLHPGGVQEYIARLGEPWLKGLAPYKPDAFFIDSFELIGELPWSSRLRDAFRAMHGYDVAPYLPLVFRAHGESKYLNMIISPSPAYQAAEDAAVRVREDYELTREQLFLEAFVQPLGRWLREQGVALRLQAHGGYGDYLDTYQLADVPEAEGLFAGGSGDFLRLAASAGHVAGRSRISSETFVTIGLDFAALDADDYHHLAGQAFASGINRLVYHGYAYHRPLATTR